MNSTLIPLAPVPTEEKPASRLRRLLRTPQRSWEFNQNFIYHANNWISRRLGGVRTNYAWQKAVTTCARLRGRTADNNFLLLGACRSGTTAMTDYLNCHPRVRCRGEILNADHFYYGRPRNMSRNRIKLHVESFFSKPPGIMAGAKFLTYQLDDMRLQLTDLMEPLHQPRVIVLYREQTLEQYASLKRAERTGIWHSNQPAKSDPIRLDVDDFLAFFERECRMWRENLNMLEGYDVHLVTYEQLHARPCETMRGVFEHLGLNYCPVESFVAKLHDQPLSERVANYQDFVRSGATTKALRLPFPAAPTYSRRAA